MAALNAGDPSSCPQPPRHTVTFLQLLQIPALGRAAVMVAAKTSTLTYVVVTPKLVNDGTCFL
jgi:hypothetical protein